MQPKRFFFVLLVLLLLSIGAIFEAYYIGNGQLKSKSTVVSNLIADKDVSQEKIIRLEKARKDTKDVGYINSLLDRLLPRTKQQDKLVADIIYTATAQAGIPYSQVTTFSFSGSNDPNTLSGTTLSKSIPGVYEYPFNLQVIDISYGTLLQFLREIENNGRILQVDNIQISASANGPNLLTVSLALKAYLKP